MATDTPTPGLANLGTEDRRFAPDPAFAAQAVATAELRRRRRRPAGLLGRAGPPARLGQPCDQTLDWSNAPFASWFVGGQLNVAYNCADRHVEAGHGDRVAIHFEGEPGDTRTITYAELSAEVKRAANALTGLGVARATGSRSTCR